MFQKTKLYASLLAAISGSMFMAPGAMAQETQRVEITGSSIKRIGAEGALPVQTITQEDIKRSGVTSVTDLMQSMSVMQGFTSIADSVGGGGGGITTASIHDVGEQYTLVLLNGRRVAPATSGTTIDLNSIPLAAIERVEVLTDGASALYGADAIAGVVNFILKHGAAPLEVSLKTSTTEQGGGEQTNFAISKGFGDLDANGYELFVAASLDKTKQLKASQRKFAKTGILSGTDSGLIYDFFNGSSRSVPPNVDVRGPAIGGYRPDGSPRNTVSFNPYYKANGVCPPDHVSIGSQCYFDYTSTVEIAPESERKALYGSGKLKLGGTGWNLFADLAYTDVSTIARIAPYPAEFSLAQSHPYYTTYVLPYLTPAQAALVTSVNVKYRLYDMGNRTYDYNSKALHTVLGTEGSVGPWDMRAAVTVSSQKQDQNYLAGFPLADKFQAGIDAQAFDPFPYTLGTMPATQLAALKATQYTGNYNTTDIKMVGFDANAQRSLFKMAGGDAMISLGADSRKTGYKVTANQAVANAEILFDDPQPEYDLSRTNAGLYAEMSLPFSKSIEGQLAARYDQISGVTDSAHNTKFGKTESAGTYKASAKWRAADSVLVRASYGTGFRAATMLEIAQPKADFGVTSGTYDCPFTSTYDPLGYVAANYVCDEGTQKEAFTINNPNLKPERSTQWNLGVVLQPTNNLSVGLNYWAVEVKDAVTTVTEKQILDPLTAPQHLDLYTTKTKASNGLTYVAILLKPVNIGRAKNSGIDWDLNYKQNLGFGKFEGRLGGTHLLESGYSSGTEWATSLGKFGINDAVSFKNVITASGTVSYGNWDHTLTANYRDGYTDQPYSVDDCVFLDDAGDCKAGALNVKSYTTLNWRTSWKMNKNTEFVLGINNLLNTDPPLSLRVNGAGHQLGYDPRYASPYGRTYSLQAIMKF